MHERIHPFLPRRVQRGKLHNPGHPFVPSPSYASGPIRHRTRPSTDTAFPFRPSPIPQEEMIFETEAKNVKCAVLISTTIAPCIQSKANRSARMERKQCFPSQSLVPPIIKTGFRPIASTNSSLSLLHSLNFIPHTHLFIKNVRSCSSCSKLPHPHLCLGSPEAPERQRTTGGDHQLPCLQWKRNSWNHRHW